MYVHPRRYQATWRNRQVCSLFWRTTILLHSLFWGTLTNSESCRFELITIFYFFCLFFNIFKNTCHFVRLGPILHVVIISWTAWTFRHSSKTFWNYETNHTKTTKAFLRGWMAFYYIKDFSSCVFPNVHNSYVIANRRWWESPSPEQVRA